MVFLKQSDHAFAWSLSITGDIMNLLICVLFLLPKKLR